MKKQTMAKIITDILLTVLLMLLMAFERIGSVARTVHMLAAYWGFVFMSLHLGFHWNMMMGMAGRLTRGPSRVRSWVLRLLGLGIAVYGVYGFVVRRIGSYMFLRETFVFFDFQEPLFLFYVDYIAIMGLFVWLGHYAAAGMRALAKRKK